MRVLFALIAFFALVSIASAKPAYLNELALIYPDSQVLNTTRCQTCHNNGKALNSFGKDYAELIRRGNLDRDEAYAQLGEIDSDEDGVSNLEELTKGTNPGKADITVNN